MSMQTLKRVVLTIAIFLALMPCYCVADGSDGSDDSTGEGSQVFSYLITNQLLYELTRKDGTAPLAEIVQGWVSKIGETLKLAIRYTKRLHTVLVRRANYIKQRHRNLSGGVPRRRFLQQKWELKLERGEFDTPVEMARHVQALEEEVTLLSNTRDEMKDRLTSLEAQTVDQASQNHLLSDQVDALQQKLKSKERDMEALQKTTHLLADKVRQVSAPNTRGRSRTKSFSEYSQSHQRRLKRQRSTSCKTSLSWLEMEGYTPVKVEMLNQTTGEYETLTLGSDILGPELNSVSENDLDIVNMMLLVKDRYDVSSRAYHEMASICKSMPKHYKLKRRIQELNKLWNIQPTPSGTIGVQQSLENRLRLRLLRLLKVAPQDAIFRHTKQIRVKLSGDGTWVGKRLHVVNFTFTIPDEGPMAYSSDGNHVLAILKVPESYESLANALEDIRREVCELKEIEVDANTYEIIYFLGGDWKFLALATGIDSASSKYSCIWCKCPMTERGDLEKKWSISDPAFGARSIKENMTLAALPKSRKQFNVSHSPLFPTIPLVNVMIDNLHLFLRVADVLINHLIEELRRQDAIEKAKRFASFECSKYKHLYGYEQFVASLGIPSYHFYIGKNSRQLKCRTLTGPEKLKLFSHINIRSLLPSVDHTDTMQELWDKLLEVNTLLSVRPEDVSTEVIDKYEQLCRNWGLKYLELYHKKEVTPYIHAMICHVGEFMRIHGCLLSFTQHGLEKYNDTMTKDFFRCSSHKGEQALVQILQKQNRVEYLLENDAKRCKHHEVTCANCSTEGHNKLTCTWACKYCDFKPFKEHLLCIDGKYVPRCEQENVICV